MQNWQPPTSSAEGSPVRTLVTLEILPALRGSKADYGLISPVWFADYDPDTSSWRTRQGCLLGGWEEFSQTWPQAGMTRNGTASRLRPSMPLTYERESGYWPTLLASESKRGPKHRYSQGGCSLSYVLGGTPNPTWCAWLMGFPLDWLHDS